MVLYRLRVLMLLLFILPSASMASYCYRQHMQDAIRINRERMPLYADLSQGQSTKISEKLIRFEKQLLFLSYTFANFDFMSSFYEKYNLNITCDDYVSMNSVTTFNSRWPQGAPNPSDFVRIDTKTTKKILFSAYHKDFNLEQLLVKTKELLKTLDREPRFNCMVRHALESIARISLLAPKHEKILRDNHDSGAISLARQMVFGHIFMLGTFNELDVMAAPLSAQGLPILCQDIPKIPLDVL